MFVEIVFEQFACQAKKVISPGSDCFAGETVGEKTLGPLDLTDFKKCDAGQVVYPGIVEIAGNDDKIAKAFFG